ncbi:MAG: hypothetical protein ACYTGH_04050 [Planctomycetota bacterium]|jgi:hypothetical protein
MQTIASTLVSILLFSSLSLAAPLDLSTLPAQSRWILHVDAAALRESPSLSDPLKILEEEPWKTQLANFAAVTACNPLKDLESITACGADLRRENAILYIRGRLNPQHLTALMAFNPGFQQGGTNEKKVISWNIPNQRKNNPKRIYATFVEKSCLILSPRRETLDQALAVLAKTEDSLADGGALALTPAQTDGLIVGVARGLNRMEGIHPDAAIVRKMEDVTLSLQEGREGLDLQTEVSTQSAQTAGQLLEVAQGMLALAQLSEESQPRLAELSRKIKLEASATLLRARARFTQRQVHERVRGLLRQVHQQAQGAAIRAAGARHR